MPHREYFVGRKHIVRTYISERGESPVEDFLAALQEKERKKMVALIEHSAREGPPRNIEKCRQVEGYRFLEFKTHGHRILWRWARDGSIVLMHGFIKRSDRTRQADLDIGTVRYEQLEREL